MLELFWISTKFNSILGKCFLIVSFFHSSYTANIVIITTYCLCLLFSIPLVLILIYNVTNVRKLYEEMLNEEKRKRMDTIFTLGSTIHSLRDFGALLKRSISRDSRTILL